MSCRSYSVFWTTSNHYSLKLGRVAGTYGDCHWLVVEGNDLPVVTNPPHRFSLHQAIPFASKQSIDQSFPRRSVGSKRSICHQSLNSHVGWINPTYRNNFITGVNKRPKSINWTHIHTHSQPDLDNQTMTIRFPTSQNMSPSMDSMHQTLIRESSCFWEWIQPCRKFH